VIKLGVSVDKKQTANHTLPSYIENPSNPKPAGKNVIGGLISTVKHTIQSFINDPLGIVGAGGAKKREDVFQKIDAKYRHLLSAHGNAFKYNVFKVADSVIIRVKVPSESVEGVFYDVAIEFMDVSPKDSSLLTKNIRIFSNNSAFAFTYAYVFEKQGMLIPYFRTKLPEMCLTVEPKVRNPREIMNYEKSVVFAVLFIREHRLFLAENFFKQMVNMTKFSIKDQVKSFQQVEQEYKAHKSVQHKEKPVAMTRTQAADVKRVAKAAGATKSAARVDASKQQLVARKARVANKVNNKVDMKVKP
jgi:cell fate (sporulation/competence/biofilm development) regulator YmcA (YheA/YmcA/DUF963 family)